MKPVINMDPSKMPNQELNEWVAKRIFEFQNVFCPKYGDEVWIDYVSGEDYQPPSAKFDYCNDLNHARLMEEKIREMGELWRRYCLRLGTIANRDDGVALEDEEFWDWNKIHASARHRCEAAFLAFGGKI